MKNILVVSSYPKRGEHHSTTTVGGASYTKKLLEAAMSLKKNISFFVFGEKHADASAYTEGNIYVDPFWQRNNLFSLLSLAYKIFTHPADIKVISLEVYMFGSLLFLPLILVAFALARLRGAKTVALLHQVPVKLSNLNLPRILLPFLEILRILYYKVFSLCFSKIIVFEAAFKKAIGASARTFVLPHMVFAENFPKKSIARKKLHIDENEKIALFFGYLAPYKGIDDLVLCWRGDTKLLIAGDINPNHKDNKNIKEFREHLRLQAKGKNIQFSGFIPEELIVHYFAASDVVLLPYKVFMSSSGPLSFALAAQKPFLLSPALKGYLESEDMKESLAQTDLSVEDLFLSDYHKLDESIKNALSKKSDFVQLTKTLKQKRSPLNIAKHFVRILES